jgi:hypothetical protein
LRERLFTLRIASEASSTLISGRRRSRILKARALAIGERHEVAANATASTSVRRSMSRIPGT